jgi:hypothetical protein
MYIIGGGTATWDQGPAAAAFAALCAGWPWAVESCRRGLVQLYVS